MRRLFALVPLLLILALAACGGTTPGGNSAPAGEPRVLAAAAGSISTTREPQVAAQGAVEPPPFVLAQGLALEGVTSAPIASGGFTFSGTVANRGQETLHATRISIDLLDASGQVAANASFSGPQLPTLKPGETAKWQGIFGFSTKPWQELRPTVEATAAGQ